MRVSGWSGLVVLLSFGVFGCVMTPPVASARHAGSDRTTVRELDYLVRALDAGPGTLDKMFRAARQDSSPAAQLRQALIESMPDYSGYDPAAAASRLQALQSGHDDGIAAIARLRLGEMDQERECEQKLHKIVVIERSLDASPPH